MKIHRFVCLTALIIMALTNIINAVDRRPEIAGSFYPDDSTNLYKMVDSLLVNANSPVIQGTPVALISPHAGFIYSGVTAASAYQILEDYPNIGTAIILGFKHRVNYRGVAIWATGNWITPLGKVPINEELAKQILKTSPFMADEPSLFGNEHSLETQIPYLQTVRPDISIVPLQIGAQEEAIISKLTETLYQALKNRNDVIIIASTDMTHYQTRSTCAAYDSVTAGYIVNMDGKGLWKASENGQAQLCGAAPVAIALEVAKKLGADNAMILRQSDSGDYGGNTESVVSYLSAVVYRSHDGQSSAQKSESKYLSDEEHKLLLNIARSSIEAYVNNTPAPEFEIDGGRLAKNGAAFVTITIDHNLRGCIGFTEPIMPLYQTIATCAVKAASEDPRFPKLTKEEYPQIKVEISVLTPLERIRDVNKIEIGKHGLMVQKGYQRGLLLPQVATEYGWSRDKFLNQTCLKAGMAPDCWEKGCDIYIFSAEVFGED